MLAKALQELDARVSAIASSSSPATALAANGWSVDQSSGRVNVSFFGDVNMQGNSILDIKKMTGYLGKWSIDEEGTLMAVRVVTDEVVTKRLAVSATATFGSAEKPIGITLYDPAGAPYCVRLQTGGALESVAGTCATIVSTQSTQTQTASSTQNTQTQNMDSIQSAATQSTATTTPATGSTDSSVSQDATSTPPVGAAP